MKLSTLPTYFRSYLSSHPSYIILYVTSLCNQKCEFCFYADSLNAPWGDGLSLEEITKVAVSVNPCIHWTLTGGETFVRRDLVDVVDAIITKGGARNMTFPTNGSLTFRVLSYMESMCKAHPFVDFRIALSIDAVGEKHDQIRVMKGAFRKAEATFEGLKGLQNKFSNLHLVISTVASKYNKDDLKELIDYSVENLWCDDHSLLLARGNPKQSDAKDITADEYNDLVEYLEKRKSQKRQAETFHKRILKNIETETRMIVNKTYETNAFQLPCVAGDKLAVLYESGDLYPCEIIETLNWPDEVRNRFGGNFKIGNVREYNCDVTAMLKSDRGREIQNFIIDSKCYCTFECAIAASLIFNPSTLMKKSFKLLKGNGHLQEQPVHGD